MLWANNSLINNSLLNHLLRKDVRYDCLLLSCGKQIYFLYSIYLDRMACSYHVICSAFLPSAFCYVLFNEQYLFVF